MLMTRRRRREKEIEIYVNKTVQVNNLKYLGIIFDSKLLFREHINYIEENTLKKYFYFPDRLRYLGD